ncbi:MAG TPA: 3-hydroxyacyl-CoA dehydrogenase NAD-binding domain-containing protein [Saprospiraceae bacterium]|nr:3-hydroxyacyl-CoA dehydrogenase NAD-binding domain-containing protein [Saprospiraceae bacterium]
MTIGIIGAGSMGSGIAQVAATAGHRVVLYDAAAEAVAKALAGMEKTLGQLETKGKLPAGGAAAILSRIEPAQELSGLQAAECVIEAIVENLEIKKSLFRALEPLVSPHCILATNTSSLSVTALAAVCERPERCIGLHFFNPAPIMRLVELAPALQTSEAVMEQAETLMRQWGKTPVRVKDTPGFIVNRVARPFYGEALRILDEGMAGITGP